MPFDLKATLKSLIARLPELRIGKDRAILMSCIGIALFFWLLVKLSQNYSMSKEVVVNIQTPVNKALATAPPKNVRVELTGSGWQLLGEHFASPRIALSYDANDVDEISISRGQLQQDIQKKLSSGALRIANISHDNIYILLEEKVHKKVPVTLSHRLAFAPEFQIKDPVILSPDSVLISGPGTLIDSIKSWPTDSLIASDLKNDIKMELALKQPPAGVLLETYKTKVFVEVETYTAKSLFIPLTIINAPDSVRVFPDRIKLECTVGLSFYSAVDASGFVLEVDLGEASSAGGKNTTPIVLKRAPDFVKNIRFTPKAVEFFIFKD